jgi:hypothetical protein
MKRELASEWLILFAVCLPFVALAVAGECAIREEQRAADRLEADLNQRIIRDAERLLSR